VSTITVTPTVNQANATVTVNGTAVATGVASGNINLNVGANTITTVVTAQDGTTTKTYTTTVTRAAASPPPPSAPYVPPPPSNNALLSSISIINLLVSPSFTSSLKSYSASVANNISSISVTPISQDTTASIKVNGVLVASGSASQSISLLVGGNPITTVVTAQDGITTATYMINVIRAGSNLASLSSLSISQGTLSPSFSSGNFAYTDAVANNISSITLTPISLDSTASIKVNGVSVISGSVSQSIPLLVGSNLITTVVTAQDGITSVTYTINVIRAESNLASLSSLSVSQGTLSPRFISGNLAYTNVVENNISSITVTPISQDTTASIKVNGVLITSGSASQSIPLLIGGNSITTVVTAQDGITTATYTLDVLREKQTQATMKVIASPSIITASPSTNSISTLNVTGGSSTGAVIFSVLNGTCMVSGNQLRSGSVSEICTVSATKAADTNYQASTATTSITVNQRVAVAQAAADPSVNSVQTSQSIAIKQFSSAQVLNITSHIDSLRNTFDLRNNSNGIGMALNINKLNPIMPLYYKIKEVFTNSIEQDDSEINGKMKPYTLAQNFYANQYDIGKNGESPTLRDYETDSLFHHINENDLSLYNEKKEDIKYNFWSVGSIELGTIKNSTTDSNSVKYRAQGLTIGLDYKVAPKTILGAALGYGINTSNNDAAALNYKTSQITATSYTLVSMGNNWMLDSSLGYGVLSFNGTRYATSELIPMGFVRAGEVTFGALGLSKVIDFGHLKVSPIFRRSFMKTSLSKYAEMGSTDYSLSYDASNSNSKTTTTELLIMYDLSDRESKMTVFGKFSAQQIYNNTSTQNVYYTDLGSGSGIYSMINPAYTQFVQTLKLGINYQLRKGGNLQLSWGGTVGAYQLNSITLSGSIPF
jgi:hypothetical protein